MNNLKSQHQHEQSQISTRAMCCFQFDVDLAKKEANKPEENDDELKKKLWLRIGRTLGCQYFLYWLQWNYFYLLDILFYDFLVHMAIHKFKIPTKNVFKLVMMHIILKPKNLSVHEHVHCHQTMTFCAHEIKCFHSIQDWEDHWKTLSWTAYRTHIKQFLSSYQIC